MPEVRRLRRRSLALATALGLLAAACGGGSDGASSTTTEDTTTTTALVTTTAPAPAATEVGERRLDLDDAPRGRALPTTVWYPARTAGADAPAGEGPYPVVLFSHALGALPQDYRALITGWVQDGFVVVAPEAGDGVQPADASFALTEVLALGATAGDLFDGVLDADRIAAAGHSEGAVTTVGLFDGCCRDERLRAAIVLAGSDAGFDDPFAGSPASMLFVHGDADAVMPYALAQATYEADPWPKAFLTLPGEANLDPFVQPISGSFALVQRATLDFLNGVLLDDAAALADLRSLPGIDDQLG